MKKNVTDKKVCIIGAGVVGASLAAYLGKHGVLVTIIEKDLSEQDKIIGELLQPDGYHKLQSMEIANVVEGIDAQELEGYAIYKTGEFIQIPYPKIDDTVVHGRGFVHGKFVQNLRAEMQKYPSVRVIEGSVTELIQDEEIVFGMRYTERGSDEEQEVRGDIVVVCDGFASKFRKDLSIAPLQVSSYFLGMVLENCALPYPNHGHVFITDDSPFLCYPITSNKIRILIDFPGTTAPRKSPELTKHLLENVQNYIPQTMRESFRKAVEEGKFKTMPNSLLPAKPILKYGGVIIGDALNMRHPLTGGGMTVALTDVFELGKRIINADSFYTEKELIDDFYKNRKHTHSTINILADALYQVVKSPELSHACFEYLKQGGKYSEEPLMLLSGVSRDNLMLMKHFFSVALYSAKDTLMPFPTINKMLKARRVIGEAVNIVEPLLNNEEKDGVLEKAVSTSKILF